MQHKQALKAFLLLAMLQTTFIAKPSLPQAQAAWRH